MVESVRRNRVSRVGWGLGVQALAGLALAAVAACGGGEAAPSGVANDAPRAVAQLTADYGIYLGRPHVMLLLVDDAPTAEGRALREFLAQDLRSTYPLPDICDPAEWRPESLQVVLISPSDPTRTQTSESNPELGLVTQNATEAEITRWQAALGDAIRQMEAPELRPLLALAELDHWSWLLRGERTPRTELERRFRAGMPADAAFLVRLATTRDDGGTPPLDDPFPYYAGEGLFWDPTDPAAPCSYVAFPRLSGRGFWLRDACRGEPFIDRRVDYSCNPGDFPCLGGTPALDSEGRAECRVLAHAYDLEECPRWAGWANPLDGSGKRVPRSRHTEYGEERVCEVLQLEGAALDSCRTDPSCADCDAGFCFPESPRSSGCTTLADFRFPFGADVAARGRLEITCNVAH